MSTATAEKNTSKGNVLALVKKDVVDVVQGKVQEFINRGELHLPPNYSPYNAMKAAWLTLQSTIDKNGKPALAVCTRDSVANALLDMVIQGLNPAKKQCYFVVYGNKLVCMRSYFGSMTIAKNIAGAKDVWAEVVYKDDDFEYEIKGRRKRITKHVQKLENVKSGNIIAAYAVIEFEDDRPEYTEIMTIDQIKRAWAQGQTYKEGCNGTHQKFDDQMCKKTVINRACKAYINSSSDSGLLLQAFNRADDEKVEREVAEEIEENANAEMLDVEYEVADEDIDIEEEAAAEEPTEDEKPAEKPKQQKTQQGKQQTIFQGPGF